MVYYVDKVSGADSNDGTTKPWRSLAKVNSSKFTSGDQILLRCGQIWNEKLIAPSSGILGTPITFGAFGPGPHPVIDLGGAGYPGISIVDKDYVSVKYIDVWGSTNVGILLKNSLKSRVEGCNLKNTKSHAISVEGESSDCIIYNNTLTLDSSFIHIGSFIHAQTTKPSITISYNKAVMGGNRGLSNGIFIKDIDNAIIHHNEIRNSTEGIGVNALNKSVTGTEIYLNAVYDTTATHGDGEAIELTGNNYSTKVVGAAIHHNLVQRSWNGCIDAVYTKDCEVCCNILMGPANSGFHWTSNCLNVKFYNNALYNFKYGFILDPDCTADIENNIVIKCTSRGIGATTNAVTEDFNIYYICGRNNIPYGVSSQVDVDPMILQYPPTSPTEFGLKLGSPAMNSGVDVGGLKLFSPRGYEFPFPIVEQIIPSKGVFAY